MQEIILDQAYFHIHNGGLTISFIEYSDKESKEYFIEFELSNFCPSMKVKINIDHLSIVKWLIECLTKLEIEISNPEHQKQHSHFHDLTDYVRIKDGQKVEPQNKNVSFFQSANVKNQIS